MLMQITSRLLPKEKQTLSSLDKDKCDVNSHIFLLRRKAVTFVMTQSRECQFSVDPVRKEIFVFSKHLPIISFFNLDLSEKCLVRKVNMLKWFDRTHSHWQWCFSPILTLFNIPNNLNLGRLRRFLTERWTKLVIFLS